MLRLSRFFVDLADDFRHDAGFITDARTAVGNSRHSHRHVLHAFVKNRNQTGSGSDENAECGLRFESAGFLPRIFGSFCDEIGFCFGYLALSVETRGFTIGKEPYTIYKKESFVFSDFLFLFGLTASAAVTAVL